MLTQLVPIAPFPFPIGALKSFPIMFTQRLVRGESAEDSTRRCIVVGRELRLPEWKAD